MNNLKTADTWKIQLTITYIFISSIDNYEEGVMRSKSDKIEIMINDEAADVINFFFELLKKRYQNNLESIKGSEFGLDYAQLLYYKCHKINTNCCGLYINSPDWIKIKKATISPINKNYNNWFQYAVTVMLNRE